MEMKHAETLLVQLEAQRVKTVQVVLVWKLVMVRLASLETKAVQGKEVLVFSRLASLETKAVRARPVLV